MCVHQILFLKMLRPCYEGEIQDEAFLKKVFDAHTFSGVIHFAGLKSVGESCKDPYAYYQTNIVGSINLLKQMKEHEVKNIIFSSSACVYAATKELPITESYPTGPSNPYGTTKLAVEYILKDFVAHQQFCAVALRYFNPIGAHESGKIGESPRGIPNNLLPYIYDVAKGKRAKLGVFGSDYPTPDGSGIRDYIDVNDLAEAHLAAWKMMSQKSASFFEIINIGVGKGRSVFEMIEATKQATGKDIPFEILPRRDGDLAEVYADVKKAKEMLGWEAKRDLSTSLANGWNFAKKQP